MGSVTFMVTVLSATLLLCEIAASNCPPVSQINTRTPVCAQDHDCKYGRICCRNSSNGKSCVDGYAFSNQNKYSKDYHSDSPWQHCNGVKCIPYEVCKPDPHTGKLKCQLR